MTALSCFRLREALHGKPVLDFDEFVDMQNRRVTSYGPVSGRDFDAKLWISASGPRPPDWGAFVQPPFNAMIPSSEGVAALIIVRLKRRPQPYFAFTFGPGGRFLLRDAAWNRGYGLRTALNLMYPKGGGDLGSLLAVTSNRHGSETVRAQRQSTRAVAFEAFDLDRLRDVLNGATGRPANPDTWGSRVTGRDALTFTTDRTFEDLAEICEEIEAAHDRRDYRERFAWLDHLQPVTDPELVERLEMTVIEQLQDDQATELDLAPPEIIDWSRVHTFQFHFDTRGDVRHPDLRLQDYLTGARARGLLGGLTARRLGQRRILALDGNAQPAESWSVWRCLTGQIDLDDSSFILDEGSFFEVETDFLAQLDARVTGLVGTDLDLPAPDAAMLEQEYNASVATAWGEECVLLDRLTVRTENVTTPVEICDILTRSAQLIHVKRHLGSRDLSHLFAQGAVSAELLQESQAFRRQVQEKVAEGADDRDSTQYFDANDFVPSRFAVVYAIVADWRGRSLAQALPFFSKINLRRTAENLGSRGFRVACACVQTTT